MARMATIIAARRMLMALLGMCVSGVQRLMDGILCSAGPLACVEKAVAARGLYQPGN
jgi:hypothetical protein